MNSVVSARGGVSIYFMGRYSDFENDDLMLIMRFSISFPQSYIELRKRRAKLITTGFVCKPLTPCRQCSYT